MSRRRPITPPASPTTQKLPASSGPDLAAIRQAAQRIHDDGMHILVDVSGHTAKHRLPMFALKPGPVQVSWLAYLSTTGVSEIDWVIADRHIAPEHVPAHFVESIWRMRDSYVHLSQPAEMVALTGSPARSQASSPSAASTTWPR